MALPSNYKPLTYRPPGTMATIPSKVDLYLSVHGLAINDRIKRTYYDKKKYALNSITNGTRRPAKPFRQDNKGTDQVILEAAINVQANLKDLGMRFDLHHMDCWSKGGSSNVHRLRLVPSCINKFIEDGIYTDEEVQEVCETVKHTAIGKQKGIPDWFKCCPVEEFLTLVAENVADTRTVSRPLHGALHRL